jgi:hypothetical protein
MGDAPALARLNESGDIQGLRQYLSPEIVAGRVAMGRTVAVSDEYSTSTSAIALYDNLKVVADSESKSILTLSRLSLTSAIKRDLGKGYTITIDNQQTRESLSFVRYNSDFYGVARSLGETNDELRAGLRNLFKPEQFEMVEPYLDGNFEDEGDLYRVLGGIQAQLRRNTEVATLNQY